MTIIVCDLKRPPYVDNMNHNYTYLALDDWEQAVAQFYKGEAPVRMWGENEPFGTVAYIGINNRVVVYIPDISASPSLKALLDTQPDSFDLFDLEVDGEGTSIETSITMNDHNVYQIINYKINSLMLIPHTTTTTSSNNTFKDIKL